MTISLAAPSDMAAQFAEELPNSEATPVVFEFSDVALKNDGSFVVTVAGNRCHVTPDYNMPLFAAVQAFVAEGGQFTQYAEDIIVEVDPALLAKLWIDAALKASENVVSQFRDARDLGDPLPIAAEQFTELLTWRRAVRDWPQANGYPSEATRPDTSEWIRAVLQNGE